MKLPLLAVAAKAEKFQGVEEHLEAFGLVAVDVDLTRTRTLLRRVFPMLPSE